MSTWEDVEGKPPRPGRGLLWRFLLAGLVIFVCAAGTTATAGAARNREARSGRAMAQRAGGSGEISSREPRRSRIRL